MQELQTDNLAEIVRSKPKVVVQYGAGWCGNCRMIKPKFRKLGDTHADLEFVYVDAEKFPESRKLATVANLPTFAVFRDGLLVAQNEGNKIETVENLIQQLRNQGDAS